MNFRVRDRIALAIYSIIGLCISAVFACIAFLLYNGTLSVQLPLIGYAGTVIGAFVLALFMLIYSLCMLRLSFRHKPKKDRNSVTVQNTQQGNGEVRVSVQALDALVKQAVAGNSEGVADIKTNIVNHDDSISVKIEMSLHGDAHIPNITMLLQSSIKNYIEEFSGIAVRDVSIMVKTIIPVMPQLAIEEKPSPVVLEENEHREMPAPQLEPTVEEVLAAEAERAAQASAEQVCAEETVSGGEEEQTDDFEESAAPEEEQVSPAQDEASEEQEEA